MRPALPFWDVVSHSSSKLRRLETTVRYLGIEGDDALKIAEQTDVYVQGAAPRPERVEEHARAVSWSLFSYRPKPRTKVIHN